MTVLAIWRAGAPRASLAITDAFKEERVVVVPFKAPVVAIALLVIGFGPEAAISAPPRSTEARAPAAEIVPSRAVLAISAPLSTLRDRIESVLPTRLLDIDENRDACVPAKMGKLGPIKTKISPEIDCHLSGHVDRGPVSVTGSGDAIVLSVPITATVTVRGRGEIGRRIRETASGAVAATVRVRPTLALQLRRLLFPRR